jgi:hypothetical protein
MRAAATVTDTRSRSRQACCGFPTTPGLISAMTEAARSDSASALGRDEPHANAIEPYLVQLRFGQ